MKWVEVILIPDQEASTVTRVITTKIILWHSVCRTLLSDQGQIFMSNLVKEVCKLLGANKVSTIPYHPYCKSQTENLHQTLHSGLARFMFCGCTMHNPTVSQSFLSII
jgi:hypothetical protein